MRGMLKGSCPLEWVMRASVRGYPSMNTSVFKRVQCLALDDDIKEKNNKKYINFFRSFKFIKFKFSWQI